MQQPNLLFGDVDAVGDELEAQLLACWRGEGDVFAVEADYGWFAEGEVVVCCAVWCVVAFEFAFLGGLGGGWWRRLRGGEGYDVGAYLG